MATDFEISSDANRLDIDMIHRFLSSSYWAEGRTRDVVERSIRHSLCFGAYQAGRQIGFGRVISDRAVFAYLADVFVLSAYRGQGVAKAIVRAALEHPDLQGMQVFLLRTRDAHAIYRQFGFGPVPATDELMGRYGNSSMVAPLPEDSVS
jgi:GNAT superfamily N-acetyltransferase